MSKVYVIQRECDATSCKHWSVSGLRRQLDDTIEAMREAEAMKDFTTAKLLVLEAEKISDLQAKTTMQYYQKFEDAGLPLPEIYCGVQTSWADRPQFTQCDFRPDACGPCDFMSETERFVDETTQRQQGYGSSANSPMREAWEIKLILHADKKDENFLIQNELAEEDAFTSWLHGFVARQIKFYNKELQYDKKTGKVEGMSDINWLLTQYKQVQSGEIDGWNMIERLENWRQHKFDHEPISFPRMDVNRAGDRLIIFNQIFSFEELTKNRQLHMPQIVWRYRDFVRESLSAEVVEDFEAKSKLEEFQIIFKSISWQSRMKTLLSEMAYYIRPSFKESYQEFLHPDPEVYNDQVD